jgi:gamma-glutamyltranspeptidase / glutathione hydrolase
VRVQKQLVVDFGMNIQATIEAARFSKETFAGCDVQIKARIPPKVHRDLAYIGHEIGLRGDYSAGATGGGQAGYATAWG